MLAVLGGCGGESQEADEPSGSFRVEIVNASFPAKQRIAEGTTMRLRVRNAGDGTVPDLAVTVETEGMKAGAGLISFGQASGDSRQADPNRPIWVLDREPGGGTSAYANTWTMGRLAAGATRTIVWRVTPVQAGDYSVKYRIAPGLDGKARIAQGSRASGSFDVSISDKPVPARVDDEGNVVRGEEAGAGN